MIPLKLSLNGFLSYRKAVEIDFSSFQLACITGENGAGKSSLLDAITWVLYGKARKDDESLINTTCDQALVIYEFLYEGQHYRIERQIKRGKGSVLHFRINNTQSASEQSWKLLDEGTKSDTEKKIQRTLRMDYKTFANASFFLQGKADSFALERPEERKKILASILNLEQWEDYKKRCTELETEAKDRRNLLEGRISTWRESLKNEEDDQKKLQALNAELVEAQVRVKQCQSTLDQANLQRSRVEGLKKEVELMLERLNSSRTRQKQYAQRVSLADGKLKDFSEKLEHEDEIQRNYAQYEQSLQLKEGMDQLAPQFHALEAERKDLEREISSRREQTLARLQDLRKEQASLEALNARLVENRQKLDNIQTEIAPLSTKIASIPALEEAVFRLQKEQNELKEQKGQLLALSKQLKERQAKLDEVAGASCPLCGQALTPQHRHSMRKEIDVELESMRIEWSQLQKNELDKTTAKDEADKNLRLLRAEERRLFQLKNEEARLLTEIKLAESQTRVWQEEKAPELQSLLLLEEAIRANAFLPEKQAQIKALNTQIAELDYKPETHQELRQRVVEQSGAKTAFEQLQLAKVSIAQQRETLAQAQEDLQKQEVESLSLQKDYELQSANYLAEESSLPNLRTVQEASKLAVEELGRVNQEIGKIRQNLSAYEQTRIGLLQVEQERDELVLRITRLGSLKTALSNKGVPAMLIEQELPELEDQANRILQRLSNYSMSVAFRTQRPLKSASREGEMQETLDIIISDGSGSRDYATYSGGEAFRINFSIRLALSRVLALRAGARLQTLVIDEGFGNQDSNGRQRLIEAINLVKDDFAKILVITHIEELKDAFPDHIEVVKGSEGSEVRVLSG